MGYCVSFLKLSITTPQPTILFDVTIKTSLVIIGIRSQVHCKKCFYSELIKLFKPKFIKTRTSNKTNVRMDTFI